MTSTKPSKPTHDTIRTLRVDELDAVSGGFGTLQSAINDVMKSFGDALKTAARSG
jgi:hypothetical protein